MKCKIINRSNNNIRNCKNIWRKCLSERKRVFLELVKRKSNVIYLRVGVELSGLLIHGHGTDNERGAELSVEIKTVEHF